MGVTLVYYENVLSWALCYKLQSMQRPATEEQYHLRKQKILDTCQMKIKYSAISKYNLGLKTEGS